MDDFKTIGLDENNFGESSALNVVKAFDAFPKTKPSYQERTSTGGAWTVALLCASLWLAWSELGRWWVGETTHSFAVEQGIGHDLQINLDVVVAMKCDDLHVNVQDAAGDRILASQALKKDPTRWAQWSTGRKLKGSAEDYKEEDVHDHLGASRGSKKFPKTPKISRGLQADSCRIYGSMHGNKVQGDFHITARGHGYMEMGQHLAHDAFNFSHQINELSFGPFYPSLTNPLDHTVATTETNFHKFQYFLSLVPTIYTTDAKSLRQINKYHESPSSGSDGMAQHPWRLSRNSVFTNQYAVTEQSHGVPENAIPGVFVKFNIEPLQLTIAEEWASIPALFIRLVNVVSGLLVAGGWCFQISEWARDVYGRKRTRMDITSGMLDGKHDEKRGL